MNCDCPDCRQPRFLGLNLDDWLLAVTIALAAVLLRVLIWMW